MRMRVWVHGVVVLHVMRRTTERPHSATTGPHGAWARAAAAHRVGELLRHLRQ